MLEVVPTKKDSVGALHRSLRAATRSEHMMIDRMILRFDLTRREDYGLFLNIHYSALQDLKSDWRDEDRDDFRQMTRCLQNDLHVMGISTTVVVPTARAPFTVCNRLGAAYVIRGSRLGASIVRGRVSSHFTASYLDFVPALSWAQFLQKLELTLKNPECDVSEVIRGAQITFEIFANILTQALA